MTKPNLVVELSLKKESPSVQSHRLSGLPAVIGKLASCELQLLDRAISRQHCRLSWSDQGIQVEDLHSTNGTLVNSQKQALIELTTPNHSFEIGPYCLRIVYVEREEDCFAESRGLQLLERLHSAFVEGCDLNTLQEKEATVQALVNFLFLRNNEIPLWCCRKQLKARLLHEITGLGPLETHFHDPTITEIMVNGSEAIYVEQGGKIQKTGDRFLNQASLFHCIRRIIAPVGRSIDEHSPMVDARITHQARVNAIIPPLSLIGPCLTLRKFTSNHLTLEDLVQQGALSQEAARFLILAIQCRCNLIIAGGTDSGKTTLLNMLSQFIDPGERIVTIEDTAELSLKQPHVIPLEARPANLEGKGAIPIRKLLKNSLRMRPDRIIVGECRGEETLDMLQAMNTGHSGCMTTAHANSPRDTLSRLEAMYLFAGFDVPVRAIRQQIASAIHLILFVQRIDGKRVVHSICEVAGMEEEVVLMQEIFERRGKPGGESTLQPTGILPLFLEKTHVNNTLENMEQPLDCLSPSS